MKTGDFLLARWIRSLGPLSRLLILVRLRWLLVTVRRRRSARRKGPSSSLFLSSSHTRFQRIFARSAFLPIFPLPPFRPRACLSFSPSSFVLLAPSSSFVRSRDLLKEDRESARAIFPRSSGRGGTQWPRGVHRRRATVLLLTVARLIYFVLLSAKRVTVNFMRKSAALVARAATFCSESQHNRGTER